MGNVSRKLPPVWGRRGSRLSGTGRTIATKVVGETLNRVCCCEETMCCSRQARLDSISGTASSARIHLLLFSPSRAARHPAEPPSPPSRCWCAILESGRPGGKEGLGCRDGVGSRGAKIREDLRLRADSGPVLWERPRPHIPLCPKPWCYDLAYGRALGGVATRIVQAAAKGLVPPRIGSLVMGRISRYLRISFGAERVGITQPSMFRLPDDVNFPCRCRLLLDLP
jgi:hypothetical protein